ncbi:hypothetical protein [Streptomyces sp. NBC_01750]|uniref:hypothetical protein n=1 Tax=Streptomyces sp. NBC_01750 TaxID=2975928 RepID=UPI002DDC5775|nr:hypothetical protein [Streptomyces sp. NBC_01750]WSD32203.1 hypothetical protein OG966_09975 [Streptomyces sp. NBC_01750]
MTDITMFPPSELLPQAVAELIAERDLTHERLTDFEDKWADVLAENWRAIAEGKDIRSAIDAVAEGKDGLKGTSEVAKARDARPRVVGVHQALTSAVRNADRAAVEAYRPVAGTLLPEAMNGLQAAAQRTEEAYRAFLAARDAFGAATSFVNYVRAWQGSGRPDYNDSVCNPQCADGLVPSFTEPIAEIREVLGSFKTAREPDPLVTVTFGDGKSMEIQRSQAVALARSANNEIRIAEGDA